MINKVFRKLSRTKGLILGPVLHTDHKVTGDDVIFASFKKSGRTWA